MEVGIGGEEDPVQVWCRASGAAGRRRSRPVTGGPAGVGQAVGIAIRITIITVVITNLLLSFVFWGTTTTVSLTG